MTITTSLGAPLELFGASFRTAPIEVLERLAMSAAEQDRFYREVHNIRGVQDLLLLSTCNRTEIYLTGAEQGSAVPLIRQVLRRILGAERMAADNYYYHHEGRKALDHLYRVSCGLDSMVLGETQILGQVRAAFDKSSEYKKPSPAFERAFTSAFKAARRCRAETQIGLGAVSIASAAVHLASRIYSQLTANTVAVIGAGETGRLVAEHFERLQPKRILVVNRTFERAQDVARHVGGEALAWSDLLDVLSASDVVATCVRADEPLIGAAMVETALRRHQRGALAFLDLGLPRNIDAQVNTLRNVFLYDLEALKQVVDQNLARRKKEVPLVERTIDEELERFAEWQRSIDAAPLIAALREAVESMRRAELERLCAGLGGDEKDKIDQITRAVVNKLLHGPMTSIKKYAGGEDNQRLEVVREVFHNLKI